LYFRNKNKVFILLVPNAAEPYLTIARIYEDQNDHNKAFEVNEKKKFISKSNLVFFCLLR
jgi:hypothetical protein